MTAQVFKGCHLSPHLKLCKILSVSLRRLCRILQKIQLSLKFCYSLLGLMVHNTHTHTDLIYPEIISHLSCDKTKNNSVHWQWLLPAQTLLRAAASEPPPCAGSQPTDSTRSVPDGKQKRHRHTINTHRQMANTRVYVKIPGPSSSTIEQNTHTHKSCSTCVPS